VWFTLGWRYGIEKTKDKKEIDFKTKNPKKRAIYIYPWQMGRKMRESIC